MVTPSDTSMPMTTAALVQHPEYKHIVWDLQPTEQGKASVGQGRGGPFNISYEVHGHGNRHLVWIMGLGAIKSAWQRQTKDFAHTNGDKYSSLIFDNRGMGESDMPLMRYSTSEMAKDTIELLNHVGWTRERQLHIIGISMGGMIAQEMAMQIPNRICSLSLVSSASGLFNTVGFFENLLNRINIFIPRSLDAQLAGIKHNLYTSSYLLSPDSTECVVCPFPTNGDRFAASEVAKRTHPAYSRVGFFAQAIAAGWHWKSEEQLREIGERVGKRRIMVVHGGLDRMIGFEHAKVLWRGLEGRAGVVGEIGREGEGGEEGEVEKHFVMEQGHVIPAEMRKEFMGWVEGLVDRGERMNLM